ncbi:MAG: hypothetical protein D6728_17790, partial [Cyanobacteria bacterium J055]
QDHWAQTCIESLAEAGVVSGYPDGRFHPDDPVKRVEFAVMVRQAFGNRPPQQPSRPFADVPEDFWGFGAIDWATKTGFTVGDSEGNFRPNALISRADAIVSLVNGLAYPLSPRPIDEVLSAALVDWGGIPDYARAQVATAILHNIAVNYPDAPMLRPNFAATRAEVAAFLCQSRLQSGEPSSIEEEYLAHFPELSLPDNVRLVRTLYSLLPNPQNRVDFLGVADIALSPDGNSIAATTTSNDRSGANLMLWDVGTGTLKLFLPTGEMLASAIVFHPNGDRLAYSRGGAIDLRGNLPAALPQGRWEGHAGEITDLAVSADGRWLVSAGEDRQIRLWDWQAGQLVRTFATNSDEEKFVAIDPKGQLIASSDGEAIEVWERATGKRHRTLQPDGFVGAITLSSNGRTLASGGRTPNVTLWNLNTGEVLQTLDIDPDDSVGSEVHSIAFSPDGQRLAVGISTGYKDLDLWSENVVQVWDVTTGTSIARWQGHEDTVRSIAFSTDGKTVISSSEDGTIKFWDIAGDR